MIYKVSFVVPGRRDMGGIQNIEQEPKPGDRVRIGNQTFKVLEVTELMPPRGDFSYLHATCEPVPESK